MLRYLFILAAVFGASIASGCTFVAVEAMDRVDNAVSKFVQADCELVRVAHGDPICKKPDRVVQNVYCYKRLGGVDCYEARDPIDEPIITTSASGNRPQPQPQLKPDDEGGWWPFSSDTREEPDDGGGWWPFSSNAREQVPVALDHRSQEVDTGPDPRGPRQAAMQKQPETAVGPRPGARHPREAGVSVTQKAGQHGQAETGPGSLDLSDVPE